MALHLGLIVQEEERLILLDGTAERSAKLVQVEFLHRRGEVAARVEVRIPQEFKQRAVHLVRPALGGDENGGTGALSVLGGVVVFQNLEFLDVVDGREDSNAAFVELVVVVTVEHPVGALLARSTNRK